MALAQYSDLFWFPSGALAVGVAARVFPLSSNILAPLFADAAGTIPLANPVTTDGTGTVTFWAEEGEYWLHIDSETFRIRVGDEPVDPTTELAAATLSTGVLAGGDISVNAGNPAAIDIAPLVGYVTDFLTDPFNPIVRRVDYPGGTVEMDAGALTRTVTVWLMDADQNIIQQATPSTNAQKRTHLLLGFTAQEAGVIIVDQSLPVILQQPANQLADLMASLGPFSITGNQVTPNGANLMINQSAGTMFAPAFNHFVGPVQTNDPHVSTTQAQTPAQFRHVTRTSTDFGPLENLLDVGHYDNAGVVTPIGGGAGSSTIHRVYLFPNNDPTQQLVMHYGQTVYSSLAAAVDRVGAGLNFQLNPLMRAGALICYIVATRTATDLSNTAQAVFVHAGKFATP